jgi:hypothetical protein
MDIFPLKGPIAIFEFQQVIELVLIVEDIPSSIQAFALKINEVIKLHRPC